MIQALLLDFDGTLADSMPVAKRAYLQFLKQYGITGTHSEFEELCGPSLTEIVHILKQRHQLSDTVEDLRNSYADLVHSNYTQAAQPSEGAQEFLSYLQKNNCRIALVSSAPHALLNDFLTQYDWHKYFEIIVSGEDVPVSKPDPAIYRLALEKLQIDAAEAMAVEDSLSGVKSARGAGIKVAAIGNYDEARRKSLLHTGAFQVFEDLTKLTEYMKQL